MQEIVIKYRLDPSDLEAARRELGLVGNAQNDLTSDFKKANAEAKEQISALDSIGNRGAKSVSKAEAEVEDLARATDKAGKEAREAGKKFDKMGADGQQAAKKAGSGMNGLQGIFTSIGKAVAAAFAVDQLLQFAQKTIAITAEFQKFRAVLTNTLGSEGEADKALTLIRDFAAKTPFSVQELTASFIKLTNQGLKPNREELRKLGDLASSTGKSFDQLTEAIIDAAGGLEFERLKEFGIRAQKDGDVVKFTFKGITTEVQASGVAIKDYLTGLGDLQGVSGSMAAISATLGGKISNLGDTFDSLFLSIGNASDGVIGDFLDGIGRLATELTELIEGSDGAKKSNIELLNSYTKSVTSNKALADTYTTLSGKTKLTSEEKAKLSDVSSKLIAIYGESITQINAETGALEINAKALQKKIQLEIALQSEAAKNLIADKVRLEAQIALAAEAGTRLQALRDSIGKNGPADIIGTQIEQLVAAAAKGANELRRVTQLQQLAYTQGGQSAEEYNNRVAAILPTLNQLSGAITFEAANKNKLKEVNDALLASGLDLSLLATDSAESAATSTAAITGLIEKLREELKRVTEARDKSRSEKEIGSHNQRIEAINEEIKRLLALGDARKKLEKFKPGAITDLSDKGGQTGKARTESAKAAAEEMDLLNGITKDRREADLEVDRLYWNSIYDNAARAADRLQQLEENKAEHIKHVREELFFASADLINQLFDNEVSKLAERMEVLQADKQNELALAGDTAGAKYEIEAAYAAKEADIRKQQAALAQKQAVFNKALAVAQIAMNTALGITKVIAEVPKVDFGITTGILIAAYAAMGALQAATVVAQPVPKFAKGTEYVTGGQRGKDSVLAWLMPGERVVTTNDNQAYGKTLTAIHNHKVPAAALNELVNTYLQTGQFYAPQYQTVTPGGRAESGNVYREVLRAIESQPKHITNIDENGFSRYIERGNARERRLNNRYSTYQD